MSKDYIESFDEKYRPKTLDKVIGHEHAVTRLRGIIKTKKWPKAMLFAGPSSAGKTTLARAFVADMFGVDSLTGNALHDYHELNAANQRTIDDMRELLKLSNLQPRLAPKRVFLIDEAQQVVGPAQQAMLKPLENPPKHTLFILGSMEPEKLGQAVKNRCSQFVLEAPKKDAVTKYVKRIAKGEEMEYMTPELIDIVAENANSEFRSAAHIMESIWQYAQGLDKKPSKIKKEDILQALNSITGVDDELAVKIVVAVYANKFKAVQKALLDVQDPFKMIGKMLQINTFLLNQEVLNGIQHKSVWWSQTNRDALDGVKELGKIDEKRRVDAFATVQQHFLNLRAQSGAFMVPETTLISAHTYAAQQALRPFMKLKE